MDLPRGHQGRLQLQCVLLCRLVLQPCKLQLVRVPAWLCHMTGRQSIVQMLLGSCWTAGSCSIKYGCRYCSCRVHQNAGWYEAQYMIALFALTASAGCYQEGATRQAVQEPRAADHEDDGPLQCGSAQALLLHHHREG